MGLFDKDGNMRPQKELMAEARARAKKEQRDKEADATLHPFMTRIPMNVLDKFNKAVEESGDKIQTIVKKWMLEYHQQIMGGGKNNEESDNGKDSKQ
ncbi:MAG: hypothetical protein KA369_08530 [Spirochaetes bacterium]|nr:hypothetical protein [Spirochaetota bacterium]